jgi:hypothetical protein
VHGVDNDVATVDLATATIGQRTSATFEVADAVAVLSEDLSDRYDVIVCFEALEHLSDLPAAIDGLRNQASRNMQLIVSVPNSRAFDEDNQFHVTNFGYQEALELLAEFPGALMLGQHLTEGSLIRADKGSGLDSRLVNLEHAEQEYANHFLLIANFDEGHVLAAHRSRAQLVEAPVHNRYMRNLEVANTELRRRNNELARKMLRGAVDGSARAGSAGSSLLLGFKTHIAELEEIVQRQASDIGHRDEMILAQRHELLQMRQNTLAPAPPLSVPRRVKRRLRW